MEMTSSGSGAMTTTKLDDNDYPMAAAATAAEPWPGTERKRCRRVLLVGVLVTLLLLAFFVLGQQSASMSWLQIAVAKLTAMDKNDDDGGAGFMDGPHGGHEDELLGGLLAAGMDWRSCRSRYKSSKYYKHFPFSPSPHGS